MLRALWIHLIFLFALNPAFAQQKLEIGVSFTIAPYVIQSEDRGIEIDLIREIFKTTEFEPVIQYLPLARAFISFENNALDGILNVTTETFEKSYFLTEPLITFQNCAIRLMDPPKPLYDVSDLNHGNVLAFQRATQLLGPRFADIVKDNPNYEEVANQEQQVLRLQRRRSADIIVMEQRIYDYHRQQLQEKGYRDVTKPVLKACFFAPAIYRLAFHDETARDTFNRRLQAIQDSGVYQQIIAGYK